VDKPCLPLLPCQCSSCSVWLSLLMSLILTTISGTQIAHQQTLHCGSPTHSSRDPKLRTNPLISFSTKVSQLLGTVVLYSTVSAVTSLWCAILHKKARAYGTGIPYRQHTLTSPCTPRNPPIPPAYPKARLFRIERLAESRWRGHGASTLPRG
jgi:hypothetical protein